MVHTFNAGALRKAAQVAYPMTYAPAEREDLEAIRFNCAQRAHANFTENHTSFLAALLLSGVHFPRTAASLGLLWSFSRYMYMRGYSTGEKDGRGRYRSGGMLFHLSWLGCIGLTVYSGVAMVMHW